MHGSAEGSTALMAKHNEQRKSQFGNAKLNAAKSGLIEHMTGSADSEEIT
jgi:hypothetical protein